MACYRLFSAIEAGDLQTVRELLEGKNAVNVETRRLYDRSPLHHACVHRKLQIAKYLIEERKANVHTVDSDGWTPLCRICTCWIACDTTVIEIAELLLGNGADVNTKLSRSGMTALHLASCRRHTKKLVQVLLTHGANVNAHDGKGCTPFYYACLYQHIDIIKLLLANNADRHIKTNYGLGLRDVNRKRVQEELIESYDKWPLAVSGVEDATSRYTQGASVMLNPRLSQHQHGIGMKALLLVRKLPVHEVAYARSWDFSAQRPRRRFSCRPFRP